LEGVQKAVSPNTKVTYVKGCEVIGPGADEIAQAKEGAARAQVAIVVVGENERRAPNRTATDGEGFDAATLELTGRQQELVEAVQSSGTPTIVVLINGRALATRWIAAHIPAVLEAWLPGEKGGQALAEILFGDANPSGRLPVTVPRHAGQLPVYYNAKRSKEYWVKGGWGHPYVDLEPTPLYPFGHGLSYTRFSYANLRLSAENINATDSIAVSVDVKNTGARAGTEVVQLYVRDVISSVSRPVQELRGFARVTLQPGQVQTCTFQLSPDDLALYDKELRWVVEPGEFRILLGASSEDIRLQSSFWVKP
jgi:beta-glucosidase